MRWIALLLLPLLVAATPARDWIKATVQTPAGAFVIGNPAAKVKLVEYASYTCPHCAAFSKESAAVLKGQMVKSGSTSLEFHHLIRDNVDLAAAVVARCAGVKGFAATSDAIFASQETWLPRAMQFQEGNGKRLAMYPVLARLKAMAEGAGLTQFGRAAGLSDAALDACFADQASVDRIVAMTAAVPAEVDSTPSFFVNGKLVPHVGWAGLQPVLRAAGAR